MNLLQEYKDDVHGLALLRDWLGDGGEPVPETLAQERANVCVGVRKPCHQNSQVNFNQLKLGVAQIIRAGLQLKSHVNLHLPNEGDLHVCQTCRCVLALKVWVPIKHIRAHTTDDQLAKFPDHCWIRRELFDLLVPLAP